MLLRNKRISDIFKEADNNKNHNKDNNPIKSSYRSTVKDLAKCLTYDNGGEIGISPPRVVIALSCGGDCGGDCGGNCGGDCDDGDDSYNGCAEAAGTAGTAGIVGIYILAPIIGEPRALVIIWRRAISSSVVKPP